MINLYPYQKDGLKALWDYYANGNKGNACIAWPTGTGKSIIPAFFIQHALKLFPTQRFLMMTHVKELIEQNAEVLRIVWPEAPLGIYSAGLKQKDIYMPIIYGGIQSMNKNPSVFGHRDIIFIDEAHLVSNDDTSMYLTFLATMRLINPRLKIIGMSATPYRMGSGMLTDEGAIFTNIVHDITSLNEFNKLIYEGYLAPLTPKRTRTELDISEVGINKGEFIASQLEKAVDKDKITRGALQELVSSAHNRRSILIFASGIDHAEHIAVIMSEYGIPCAAVHSKQKGEYNDRAIKAFKDGSLRAIANYGKLTTGFNHPWIDLIGVLRPTLSVPLWVQMLGRGTRPAEGKTDCMVLDFARNTVRLGPINDPIIPKKKGEGAGDAPVKICESCGVYNHAKVRFCTHCGNEFQFAIKFTAKAGTAELLRNIQPIIENFKVNLVTYKIMPEKNGKPKYLRATYHCGLRAFGENVMPEHGAYPRMLFKQWWMQRHPGTPPDTADDAFKMVGELRKPKSIRVHVNHKYQEIKGHEF